MGDRPDEELVGAAVRGDVDAFMQLCHRYYPTMVTVACAVLGDYHLAEDVAQEALAKACRSLNRLTKPNQFGAWLTTICRNQAKDVVRRTRRTESLGDHDAAEEFPEPSEESEAVRDAIERLPAESRELLYLKYRHDMSYQQMSDLLGVSHEAIHGRLRRAKHAVREYLERRRNRRLP